MGNQDELFRQLVMVVVRLDILVPLIINRDKRCGGPRERSGYEPQRELVCTME